MKKSGGCSLYETVGGVGWECQGKKTEEIRVDSAGTNRNAYNRAACTLEAMAEMLVAQGAKQEAKELLHGYYYQVFSRYSAFRREVRKAVATSPLLAGMGI
ncbi:hypothetical protein GF1_28790 [Desulfolithobacter dissulfuricans]|uniref:Uncharacterized protein n=2 Tax=Desulfolithobacter dissulfuricans TaxID=2795293 RepID=A0A915U3A9_9BACT|nr:hypothetical protein GF1_28790 [Desulfolithobacter dissulfuricans]